MVCPFIERSLTPCSRLLTLETLDRAVRICANEFTACQIFAKQIRMLRRPTSRLPSLPALAPRASA